MRRWFICCLAIIVIYMGTPLFLQQSASSLPTYTLTPKSTPFKGQYKSYNKYTQTYFTIRSYLEELEQRGGGTIILNRGTYTISNTLYVPSNVTIRLKDGAYLKKGKVTSSSFPPAKSMFQLIRPSYSKLTGKVGGYGGEQNIRFIGEGTAIIDLDFYKDSLAIIAGHNRNVTIQGIQFRNMYYGHFLEIDAVDGIKITTNVFRDSKASTNNIKEAINLDTPDRVTKGWSQQWSKFDKTPNRNVLIEDNTFTNLDRAIGTHKYSQGKYHDRVTVRGNKISNTRNDAIRIVNWSNTLVEKNIISNVKNGIPSLRGILISGAKNPTIRDNDFDHVGRPMQFLAWKNPGAGSQYAVTYNTLSSANKEALKTNRISRGSETFIRISTIYNVYNRGTEKIDIIAK